jgi:DNA mismatch repair protein MutS2
MAPVSSPVQVRTWLEQVREMIAAIGAIGVPPFGGVYDVRDAIRAAVPPAKLEPEQLAEIAETLAATARISRWLATLPEGCVGLRRLSERVGDHSDVATQIERCIDGRGQVRDDATPRLSRIRSSIEDARFRIRVVIDRLLKSSRIARMMQYANATFHDDRIVLPIKAEHRGRVPGIVHRTSDSGATAFVEPAEAVELNNTIINLRATEHEEINRILWELTQLVHVNAAALIATMNALAVLDLVVAKVHFADAFRMQVAAVNDDGVLRLRQARHPVLMAMRHETADMDAVFAEVVPIDVRLGEDFRLLIITGPNTGGKTVALKTMGLLALMHQSGLPVPVADGSTLPVFDLVLVDIGDEQSLQQSLSTFSAHMRHILDTLKRATPRTLVLLDEMCAGTDPDEGAALGRAILDELLARGARTAVSTHLGALKSYAFLREAAENAAVEFDVATLRPTYHLRIGEPGNSNAIAIAQRLGMSEQLADSARAHLSRQHRDMTAAIQRTVDSRRRAESARQAAEEAALEADRRRRDLDEQIESLRSKERTFEAWRERVTNLRPGDRVRVKRFDGEATVVRLRLQKQQVVVSTGSLELELPLSEVVLDDPPG